MSRRRSAESGRASLILIAVALIAGIVVLLEVRDGDSGKVPEEPGYAIPDVDTTGMEVQVAAAISTARANVARNPRSGKAWWGLAAVLDAHGLQAESEPAYRRAIELSPKVLEYSYNYAVVLGVLGQDLDQSLALFREAAQANPKYPPVHYRIGMILELQGELEQAVDSYRRVIALDPEFALAYRSLGQMLLALDDCQGAIESIERSVELAPTDGLAQGILAQAYACIGQDERAEALAERAAELGIGMELPDYVRSQVTSLGVGARQAYERARQLVRAGDLVGALRDFKIAATARPNDVSVQEEIAEVYRLLGDFDLARPHAERAMQLRQKR